MNVGKDPFPRDEVTGLAAFDHIEPLRSHSVVPDESIETPVVTDDSGEAESGLQARVPSAPASNTQRGRVESTLPLNLSAMPHWQETVAGEADDDGAFLEEDEDDAFTQAPATAARADATLIGAALSEASVTTARADATLIGAALSDTRRADADATLIGAALSDTRRADATRIGAALSDAAAPAPRSDATLIGAALSDTRRADATRIGAALSEASVTTARADATLIGAALSDTRRADADATLIGAALSDTRRADATRIGAALSDATAPAPRSDAPLIGAALSDTRRADATRIGAALSEASVTAARADATLIGAALSDTRRADADATLIGAALSDTRRADATRIGAALSDATAPAPRSDAPLIGAALSDTRRADATRIGAALSEASVTTARADATLIGAALSDTRRADADATLIGAALSDTRRADADATLIGAALSDTRRADATRIGAALSDAAAPAPRSDATLIGTAPQPPEDSLLSELASTVTPPPALGAMLSATAVPPSALDAMFDAAGAGWDDEDEATRVHSHPAGRAPLSASLDMEWDEDEPATEMRPFAMFDAPPLAATSDDVSHWNNPEDATSTYLPPRGGTGIRSATPTIRVPTPPLQTTLPPTQSRTNALSGGRPSPFPASQPASSEVSEADYEEDRDERDEARASAFDGLVPVPAPQLPAAAYSGGKNERPVPPPAAANAPPLWQAGGELPARFLDALKAGHKPSIVIASSGVVGLVALVLIVRALAAGGVGTAVLEVSPADARVQVDGKAVSGTSSPYTVSELTPGNHEIVVTKPGYNEYRGAFPVTAGANTKLPVIELAANLQDVGFSVRSVPPGAAVWVDGELSAAVTPAKLTGIKPGIHRLALKHEGYSDYELQMFVPEATVLQLPAAELVALPAAPVEPVRTGRRSRRGLSADEGEPYNARRTRRAEASEPASRAERTSYTSSYGTRRSRATEEDASPRTSPAAESGAPGTLRLNSRPWAQVTLDGKPIGNTPQQNLQLSPGKHKLQLSNPQLGLSKSVTINIKAGETLTQVVNLTE